MDYKVFLISTVVTNVVAIIVSGVIGWLTAKFAYKNEIKKSIYDERENIYIETYKIIELLKLKPYCIYDYDFIQQIQVMRVKITLYASNKVRSIIMNYTDEILEIWEIYYRLYKSDTAEKELENRICEYKAITDGNSEFIEEKLIKEYEDELESFQDNHLLPYEKRNQILDELASIIRTELKTK